MTGGLQLYKEQRDSLNTLFNKNKGNLFWQKYDLKKSISERKPLTNPKSSVYQTFNQISFIEGRNK